MPELQEESGHTQQTKQPSAEREAWDGIASGYDAFVTSTHLWLGEEGLRHVGLRAGMEFLDVAAGSGALSIPAARLGAKVLATDLSPLMLERLGARAYAEGLDVETRAMDGHRLELADDSFDVAGSQFGVMLFPDMPRGIREMVRVVRPGGRVLLTVFGDPQHVEFFGFFVDAIRSVRPEFTGPPMDPPPLPFQLQHPDKLRQELSNAGLSQIRVHALTEKLEFGSGEQLWTWLLNSNPISGEVLRCLQLDEAERGEVRQTLDAMVRNRATGDGPAVLTNPINIAIGTKSRSRRGSFALQQRPKGKAR
jgi:ubiquinone/menaquinone biosynthesis C-methylase UbiE